jgi:hypothetical protein
MGDKPLIYGKMIEVSKRIGAIGKNERNQMQKFDFRGIDTVYNELHDIMAEVGVFSVPETLSMHPEERKSRNGGTLIYRILTIQYTFYAEDGSSVRSTVIGEGMDSGDKASNKAMAVAHKYALLQAFTIPTKESKDPDAESHDVEPKDERPRPEHRETTYKPQSQRTGTGVFRFGKDKDKKPMKGVSFSDSRVTMRTLEWYRGAIAKNLDDPDQAKWKEATIAHLKDIDNEIRVREEDIQDARLDHATQDAGPPHTDDDMPF